VMRGSGNELLRTVSELENKRMKYEKDVTMKWGGQ